MKKQAKKIPAKVGKATPAKVKARVSVKVTKPSKAAKKSATVKKSRKG